MTKVLVSGSAGFIGGYVVQELLQRGFEVIGVDNFSKYGPVKRPYDAHPSYRFVEGDCRDTALLDDLLVGGRPFHCRGGHDRRDLLFPHPLLRPAGQQ